MGAYCLKSMPHSDVLATAAVARPCATLESDDTWTSQPFVEGVALIGDAAGCNNPLIAQDLSLATSLSPLARTDPNNDGIWKRISS